MKILRRLMELVIVLSVCLPVIAKNADAHGGDASLVHACVGTVGGIVRVVGPTENCTSSETARHWSIGGLTEPQSPRPAPVLAVYDANNVRIGDVVGVAINNEGPSRPVVWMITDRVAFLLVVTRDKFIGNQTEAFFESSNCSGAAYLSDSGEALPAVAVIGMIAYVADGPSTDIFFGSRLSNDGSCQLFGGPLNMLPAIQVDLSVYSPPFAIGVRRAR